MRRLSTLEFGRRAAAQLEHGAKLAEALDLPMIVDILETMDAAEAARFFVLGPFQTFKSLVGQLRLLRNHLVRCRPAGWYGPSGDFTKDFLAQKLNPLTDSLAEIQLLHFDTGTRGVIDRTKAGKDARRLAGGASHLALSAQTEPDRHGKTFCDIYCDEVHLYEPGWLSQISKRRGAYPEEFTETYMSTGLFGGTDAARLWADTDQRTWHCRCPRCRRLFEPRYAHHAAEIDPATGKPALIGGLRYTRAFRPDGLPDESALAATLRYECPHCHADFPDTPGTRLAFSGTAAAPIGLYVSANAHASARTYGWTYHGIAVRPWLPIVMDFERAQLARHRGDLEDLGKCIREQFAGIWTPHEHITEKKLRPAGLYRMADLSAPFDPAAWWPAGARDPEGRPCLIATVDVQQDWFRLVVRLWNYSSLSRLVYADTVTTPGRIADICDALGVLRKRTVLDRRHKPTVVRQLCAAYGWRSLMGEHDKDYLHPDGIRRVISEDSYLDPFLGTAHQGQSTIVENNFAKWTCLDRLDLLRRLTDNRGEPLWTAAADAPDWFFKEIDAYHRISKFRGVTKQQKAEGFQGEEHHEWQAIGPDHSADCEIMGISVASALGLTGAESLESPPAAPNSPAPQKP